MNKHFSLLLHSLLIVGALLPLSPITTSVQIRLNATPSSHQFADQPARLDYPSNADGQHFLAYGQGVPHYRRGGGTR